MAAGYPLPKRILCHGHWNLGATKMSKSLGNGVDPFDLVSSYSSDALRYYLIRESRIDSDTEFCLETLRSTYNGVLANQLGNLFSRISHPVFLETIPEGQSFTISQEASETVEPNISAIKKYFDSFAFANGIEHFEKLLHYANQRFSAAKPWETIRRDSGGIREIMIDTLAILRLASESVACIIPETSAKIMSFIESPGLFLDIKKPIMRKTIGREKSLFPRMKTSN